MYTIVQAQTCEYTVQYILHTPMKLMKTLISVSNFRAIDMLNATRTICYKGKGQNLFLFIPLCSTLSHYFNLSMYIY